MRWTLPSLVWVFVIAALLIGWAVVFAGIVSERKDAENAAITRSQDRAILLEQHVVKSLQVAALASLQLGQSYFDAQVEPATRARAPDYIEDPTIGLSGIESVAIFDPRGNLLASTRGANLPANWRQPFPLQDWTVGGIHVSDPAPVGRTGAKFILVSRVIRKNGRRAGSVLLFLRPGQFLNFPLTTKFDKTDLVSVIGLNGITLARREGNRFSSGEDVRGRLVMRRQLEDPNGTYLGPSSLDGLVRYFSHRRLPDFPIFVTAGVSHTAALSSANRRALGYVSLMVVMSAFGLFMAWSVQHEAAYRTRKAQELAESTRRLEEAQRIGKIGDWKYDLESGVVTWSDQLCEMYERSPSDDLLSLDEFALYLAPEGREKFLQDVSVLLSEEGFHSFEFKVILPSGAVSYRCTNAVSSAGPDGRIHRLHGTDQDITATHLIRQLEKQVAHLDRQGAMSMMAGTLAHELNQPLTAASNYLSGALRRARLHLRDQTAAVISGMEDALEQVQNAAEIIRRVRKMVQTEPDTSRSAPIRDTVDATIALLSASGFHSAEDIQVSVAARLPEAAITPVQFQQVLLNLLKNALEAAPKEGGIVRLTAGEFAEGMVRIEVRDNGPGFATNPQDVFTVFRSEKETGLGLGLSVSRTITEYHGGRLNIEKSEPGDTLIVVLLPAALQMRPASES